MTAWAYGAALLGCGLGACLRFALGWLDVRKVFPWPTIAANALGSALLGVALALGEGAAPGLGDAAAPVLDPAWVFILGAGVAGGLSTFSSLAVDAVVLAKEGRGPAAVTYLAVTLAVGLAAAWGAYAVALGLR